jgi:hypothetical protein
MSPLIEDSAGLLKATLIIGKIESGGWEKINFS